jgi:hypothetical protein
MVRGAALLPLVLLLTGCDKHQEAITEGGILIPSVSPVIDARIQPQVVLLNSVSGLCPIVSPFTTAFDLVVQERTGIDLFLDSVSMQFVDGTNLRSSPIVFPQADLTRLFPSTLISRGASRAFTFSPQFGCGIGVPETLIVTTVFLDRFGTSHSSMLQATIKH